MQAKAESPNLRRFLDFACPAIGLRIEIFTAQG
jgi:hypothetical protein